MRKIAAMFVFVALLAGNASAEAGKITTSLMTGVAIPVSGNWASSKGTDASGAGYDFGYKQSFAGAIAADYQFQEMFAAGLELGYNFNHKIKANQSDLEGGDEKILQITPYLKVTGKKMDKWTPYGILGLGLYSMKLTDEKDNSTGVTTAASSVGYLGFNLGGGMMYDLSANMQLGLDLRWHHIFSKSSSGERSAVNNITPSLKLSYLFN